MGGGGCGEGSWVKGEQSPRSNMEDDLQPLEGTLEPWVLGWGGVRYGCWHYSCQTGPACFTPPPGLRGLAYVRSMLSRFTVRLNWEGSESCRGHPLLLREAGA